MKIQWGMMMTDGRGKLGGQVASKNRAGAYVRTKVTPSNPQTSYQSLVRARLGSFAKEWASLPQENRDAWNEAVSTGEWSKTDIFGLAKNPSGFNLFVGMSQVNANVQLRALPFPPAKVSFPIVDGVTLTADELGSGANLRLSYVIPTGNGDANIKIQVQATAPTSAGKSYVKNLYRDIAVFTKTQASTPLVLTPQYEAKFGAINGNAGKRISVRVRQVNEGQYTPWQSVTAIIEPEE